MPFTACMDYCFNNNFACSYRDLIVTDSASNSMGNASLDYYLVDVVVVNCCHFGTIFIFYFYLSFRAFTFHSDTTAATFYAIFFFSYYFS